MAEKLYTMTEVCDQTGLSFGVCRQPILSAEVSMLRIWFESKFFNKDSRMFL